MNAVIDLTEVADQLVNCKPGDEYSITFVVDAKTPDGGLEGTASEIEHLGGEEYEGEEEAPAEESMPKGAVAAKSGGRVPKAILMVSK